VNDLGSAAHRGGLPELEHLTTDAQALNQVLVPFRITAFQVFQKAAPSCDHRQQSPAGMMILAVQLEMILELQNTLAQDGYLYLWRTGVGVMDSKLRYRLCLRISRQCHSRIDTPRLFLIFLYGNRIAYCGRTTCSGRARLRIVNDRRNLPHNSGQAEDMLTQITISVDLNLC
jgi:hypothetical protein